MVELIVEVNNKKIPFEQADGKDARAIEVVGADFMIKRNAPHREIPYPYYTFSLTKGMLRAITGRNYDLYKQYAAEFENLDLDTLMEHNLDKRWLEIGPGLSEFMPLLAQKQKIAGGPRPVIIDPIDYNKMRAAVEKIKDKDPLCRFGVSGEPLSYEALSDRLSIFANPEYVDHHMCKTEELPKGWYENPRNKFFVVIDHCATSLVASSLTRERYKRLVMPEGYLIMTDADVETKRKEISRRNERFE